MDLFKKCFDYKEVEQIKEMGVYPYFHSLVSKQDTVVQMEGKELIMVGSNNYLGLTSHPSVVNAGIKALKKYGSGVSGSRFLNGTLDMHLELEKELAAFLKQESCITFPTGFQSNLGIISAISGRHDVNILDKENHASIYDACRLSYAKMVRYEHNDMEDLERILKELDPKVGKLIITDGVFSMSGDICKLPEIVKLAKKYNARVMVDDAHGFGVLGKTGAGTAEHFGLEKDVDIIMGTFSKSLASIGGYCATSKEVAEYIKHHSRPFIFSAALTPANTACALEALNVLKKHPCLPNKLREISQFARNELKRLGVKTKDANSDIVPIVPIYTYGTLRTLVICKVLFEKGVYANPVIAPAAPEGECLIRTSYSSTHTKELVSKAMEIIAQTLNEVPEDENQLMEYIHKNFKI